MRRTNSPQVAKAIPVCIRHILAAVETSKASLFCEIMSNRCTNSKQIRKRQPLAVFLFQFFLHIMYEIFNFKQRTEEEKMTNLLFLIALVAILLTTILILIMMSVAKSKSKEDWLMEDAEQSECVRRMIKAREKKNAGKAL